MFGHNILSVFNRCVYLKVAFMDNSKNASCDRREVKALDLE